jgi:hypothetical protein
VANVPSIQLAIRLLVTQGSRLLELADVRALVGAFDSNTLAYPWRHADAAMDRLQTEVESLVAASAGAERVEVFRHVTELARQRFVPSEPAHDALHPFAPGVVTSRREVPWLDEPWYC